MEWFKRRNRKPVSPSRDRRYQNALIESYRFNVDGTDYWQTTTAEQRRNAAYRNAARNVMYTYSCGKCGRHVSFHIPQNLTETILCEDCYWSHEPDGTEPENAYAFGY